MTGYSPDDDEVGYGRPPKKSQFKKGQSGNPKGRPKGSKNFQTIVSDIMNQKVAAPGGDGRKTLTVLELGALAQAKKMIAGDDKAFRNLTAIHQAGEEKQTLQAQNQKSRFSEADEAVFKNALKRRALAEED